MVVEHPGNAGRPHPAVHRPTTSVHRPSGWSRSFVLAPLRALHLDQHLRPGAPCKEGLDRRAHTGNGQGRYDDALAAAARAADDSRGFGASIWVLSELIEAAVRGR